MKKVSTMTVTGKPSLGVIETKSAEEPQVHIVYDATRFIKALEAAEELIRSIQTDRKASIGSIDNTYIPQLSVRRVDDIGHLIHVALNINEKKGE